MPPNFDNCPECGKLVPDSPHDMQVHAATHTGWAARYAPGSFEATFAEIFQEAFDLLIERQKKYGPENIRQLGLWGVFGRFADDKVNRIRRAFNGTIRKGVLEIEMSDGDFNDESLEDALLDSVNYPAIMIALKRGQWGHPLEEDMDAA